MKKILLTFLFLLIALPATAAELLMFSNPHCGYCQAFLNEVAPTYPNTEYAKVLPLRVVQVNEQMPEWIAKALEEKRLQPIVATPTFVIWEDKEIARVEGYAGKDGFYGVLADFVEANPQEFKKREPKGSGSVPEQQHPLVPFMAPTGVVNSKNIFDHTYKTPAEALKASDWLGCNSNVHFHKREQVWMPCSMN